MSTRESFPAWRDKLSNAIEWRDRVNTYFYRKSGVKDALSRKIYE